MRACTKCGELKPLEAFPPVRRGEPKLQSWCRDCFAAYGREYYRKHRDGQKSRLLRNVAATRTENRRRIMEFPFRSLVRQTRQWICLACQRAYTKDWYHRNREKQIAAAYVRRVRQAKHLGRKIRDYLTDHSCVDCGESDVDVLDFDHLRDKRADVSRLVHTAVSWELVVAEIAKCEVRCANCHRRRTAIVGGHYRAIEASMRSESLTR